MKMQIVNVLAALALATSVSAVPAASADLESSAPLQAAAVGCYQQGSSSKPAICARPRCPAGYKSVFWDFGCPDGSWKCCI